MSSLQAKTAYLIGNDTVQRPAVRQKGKLTARLATTDQARADVFGLRHAAYVAGDYIDPRPGALFSDPYDDKPNSQSIVVYRDERPVASVRLCTLDTNPAVTGWDDIPVAHVFHDEVHALLEDSGSGKPKKATEINRLVRHPDFATDAELVFVLFRFVSFMVIKQESDMMLSCVRRNHIPFYKRLEFSAIAGPKSYPELKFATNLMVCPQSNYATIFKKIPMLNSNASGESHYDGLFHDQLVSV